MAAPNPERQRTARDRLARLLAHPASVYVIHYACQSLDQDERHGTPRVTSIGARNLETGAVESFSVHAEANLAHLSPVQILSRMDQLERAMLDKFFEFLKTQRAMRFVHWNMRDEVFGFPAIELRYAILGGTPTSIPESQRIDLARVLMDIYGSAYIEPPQFEGITVFNALPTQGVLAGKAEAEAFERGEYAAVKRSTLAKVRLMFDILQLAHDRSLKTKATWWELNLGRAREAYEMLERNPVHALASLAFAGVSAAFGVILKLLG